MPRPPAVTQREKTRVIMDVLTGATTLAQAAEQAGVSAQAVSNWRRQFIEAGSAGLRSRCVAAREGSGAEVRLRQLAREVDELKIALAEAHLMLTTRSGRTALQRR